MAKVTIARNGKLVGPPVWVDFNASSGGMVPLDMPGTLTDLGVHGVALEHRLGLVLYSYDATDRDHPDDLLALGVAIFDIGRGRWTARVREDSFTHQSDLDSRTAALLRMGRSQLPRPI